MWELQQAGEKSVTLHCAPNGNYEPLQCEDGWCYCIDPATATPYGSRLPEGVMDRLDCCECLDVFVCKWRSFGFVLLRLGIGSVIYIFSYRFFFFLILSAPPPSYLFCSFFFFLLLFFLVLFLFLIHFFPLIIIIPLIFSYFS